MLPPNSIGGYPVVGAAPYYWPKGTTTPANFVVLVQKPREYVVAIWSPKLGPDEWTHGTYYQDRALAISGFCEMVSTREW